MAPKNFRRLRDISPQSRTQEKWAPEQSRQSACMLKHESNALVGHFFPRTHAALEERGIPPRIDNKWRAVAVIDEHN